MFVKKANSLNNETEPMVQEGAKSDEVMKFEVDEDYQKKFLSYPSTSSSSIQHFLTTSEC